MNGREFAKYLARDLRCPCGCAGKEDTYAPHHRANRGIGGSKLLHRPANILVVCSRLNGAMESDATIARDAKFYGWKIERWQSPELTPFYDRATSQWYLIDNLFNRTITEKAA